jgi:3D (Asp-Asp-Asp) domain-containing protein
MSNLINLNKIIPLLFSNIYFVLAFFCFSVVLSSCDFSRNKAELPLEKWECITVTASAYNSLNYQTGSGNPRITAWGDTLKSGKKIIAVSRDLLKKGLNYNTPVQIEGMEGIYYVKDKMHRRWKNKIDIYMGVDVDKARKWGRKKINLYYLVENDSLPINNQIKKH